MADPRLPAPPSKTITVAGRRLTVHKKTFELTLKRFTLMEAAQASLNGNGTPQDGEGLETMIRRGFTLQTYPSLAACTTGNLFSEAECFQIDEDELERWLETARALNPLWFPSVTPETAEEAVEKKESKD
jgi:hypothetical protein